MFQIVSVIATFLATWQIALGQQSSLTPAIDNSIANLQVEGLLGRWFEVYTSSFLLNLGDQSCTVLDIMQSSQQIDNSGIPPVPIAGGVDTGIAPGVVDPNLAGQQQMPIGSGIMGGGRQISNDQHFADWNLYFKLGNKTDVFRQLSGFAVHDMINSLPSSQFRMFLNEPGFLLQQLTSGSGIGANMGGNSNSLVGNGLPLYIVALGDLSVVTPVPQYPWIVLTGPLATNFFVLARDPQQFETQYKDQVVSLLQAKGFSSSPEKVFHSQTECNYPVMGTVIPAIPIVPPASVPIGVRGAAGKSDAKSGPKRA